MPITFRQNSCISENRQRNRPYHQSKCECPDSATAPAETALVPFNTLKHSLFIFHTKAAQLACVSLTVLPSDSQRITDGFRLSGSRF